MGQAGPERSPRGGGGSVPPPAVLLEPRAVNAPGRKSGCCCWEALVRKRDPFISCKSSSELDCTLPSSKLAPPPRPRGAAELALLTPRCPAVSGRLSPTHIPQQRLNPLLSPGSRLGKCPCPLLHGETRRRHTGACHLPNTDAVSPHLLPHRGEAGGPPPSFSGLPSPTPVLPLSMPTCPHP